MVRVSSVGLLLLLAWGAAAQTPPAPARAPAGADSPGLAEKQIPNHNGGLVTYYSGNRLTDDQSQTAINIFFDRDSGVVKRGGQQLYGAIAGCASTVRSAGVLESPAGPQYLFEVCGNHVYETLGSGAFTVIGGTISTTANVYMVQTLGQEWFTDGVDYLWSTNGVNVSSYTSAPIAQLVGTFQGRVVLGNVVGGDSAMYLSGYQNGGDYTLPAVIVDTSAAIFGLNGLNDGRPVTCVSSSYRDVQILWNHEEMYGLYGSGNSSFILRKLAEIGCDEQESVQEFDGKLRWLSQYGIYQYDGLNTTRISDNVKDQILNIIATEPGTLSITQDEQAQWQAGNLAASGPGAPMSATIDPGNVVPSTWGVSIALSTSNYILNSTNGDFANGTLSGWTVSGSWTTANAFLAGGGCGGARPVTSNFAYGACTIASSTPTRVLRLDLLNSLGVSIKNCSITFSCGSSICTYSADTCDLSQPAGEPYFYLLNTGNGVGDELKITDNSSGATLISAPTAYNFKYAGVFTGSLDAFSGGCSSGRDSVGATGCAVVNYSTSGAVSSVYDTGLSTPVWGNFNFTLVAGSTGSVVFQTQVSSTLTGPFSVAATDVLGSSITSANREFVRYIVSTTTVVGGNIAWGNGLDGTVSLSAETTGYFITSCFNTSPIVAWGLFQAVTDPGNGAVSFSVSTGPTCGAVQATTATWTPQAVNATIGVSTAAFLGVRVLFNGTPYFDPDNQPTLNALTVNWQSAAGRPRTASQVFDNRYWLSYTTNTNAGAYNDAVLVFDSVGHWSQLQGINASSLAVYQRLLYSGSSLSDGDVNVQNTGTSDFGGPILFDFRTPDYELDAFNTADLYDLNLEFSAASAADAANVAVQYYADGSTVAYTLGNVPLVMGAKGLVYSNARFGASSASPVKVHTVGFEILDNTTAPITFYRSMLRYTPEDGP